MSCEIPKIIGWYRQNRKGPFSVLEARSDGKKFKQAGNESREMAEALREHCARCPRRRVCEDSNAGPNMYFQRPVRIVSYRLGIRRAS